MNAEGKSIKLLMVDDEPDFLEATSMALMRRGFEVTTVRKAKLATQVIGQENYDVAIVDLKMPELSGEKLLRMIRKSWPQLPIIVLTGHGTPEKKKEMSKMGVCEYLHKPCEIELLSELALKVVLEAKRIKGEKAR